jgi:GLPGLI family protein
MKKLIAFLFSQQYLLMRRITDLSMNINLYQIQLKKIMSTSEMMFLDITKNGSKYYSREVYVQDSIMRADLEKQMKTGVSNFNIKRNDAKGKVRYKVTKDYQKIKLFQYQNWHRFLQNFRRQNTRLENFARKAKNRFLGSSKSNH